MPDTEITGTFSSEGGRETTVVNDMAGGSRWGRCGLYFIQRVLAGSGFIVCDGSGGHKKLK